MVERIRTLLETRQLTPTQFADLIGVARPIVSHILSGRNKPSLEVVQRILAALPELSMPWLLNGTGPVYSAAQAFASVLNIARSVDIDIQAAPAAPAAPVVPVVESPQPPPAPVAVPSSVSPPPGRPQLADSTLADPGRPRRALAGSARPQRFTTQATARPPHAAAAASISAPPVSAPLPASMPAPLAEIESPILAPPPAEPLPPLAPNTSEGTEAASGSDAAFATALFAGADKPIRRIVIFYRDGSFADYQPE